MLSFPYARLEPKPGPGNRIQKVFPDPEMGEEGFTVVLEDGSEDSVHVDAVLEYNEDPDYLKELLLHRLTVEAQRGVSESSA